MWIQFSIKVGPHFWKSGPTFWRSIQYPFPSIPNEREYAKGKFYRNSFFALSGELIARYLWYRFHLL